MPIGSLAVTNLPSPDHYGRRIAVQKFRGNGPAAAGDVFVVLVDVPRYVTRADGSTFRMVDVVTFGTIECVIPSRGSKRGTWNLHPSGGDVFTVDYLTRNGAALLLVEHVERTAVEPAQVAAVLDRASNGAGAPLSDDARARLVALIEAPTLATWTEAHAHGIVVSGSPMFTLWQALLEFTTYNDTSGNPRLPTPAQVVEAIAAATDAHPADCGACIAGESQRHTYEPPSPIHTAAAELADQAATIAAAVEREESAEAWHAYADARVVELRAALAEAEEERREAREEVAAAHAAADALFDL